MTVRTFGQQASGGSATWPVPGTPATFPPSAHTHVIGDVTGLTAALPLSGVATVTVPNGRIEWTETVSATGLTAGRRVVASIGSHVDADENDPELLDVMSLSARAGTDSLTVTLAFGSVTSGPIKIEWVAHG